MFVGTRESRNSEPWDVIILGAGLGGLTCGAYLSQAGKRVLILEQASVAGGPCQTYTERGLRFSIGTNTFGNHCKKIFKELGIQVDFEPAPLCLSYRGAQIYFPFRTSIFGAAKKLGIGFGKVFGLLNRLEHACARGANYAEAVTYFTDVPALRELLMAESWYIGTPPEVLPANALQVFFDRSYGYQNPMYPIGGAQAIPEALVSKIEAKDGQLKYHDRVEGIHQEERGLWKVETAENQYFSTSVVSNLSPRSTLELLNKGNMSALLNTDFREKIERHEPALSFAVTLYILDRNCIFAKEIRKGNQWRSSTLLLAGSVSASMQMLQKGMIPEKPIVNVVAPRCLDLVGGEDLAVSVFSLWPKGGGLDLEAQFTSAVGSVLEGEWPGFLKSVKWSEFITPEKYIKTYGGISSCPAQTMENHDKKLPCEWSIPGLYAVGTGVGPRGSHAAAAMESGRLCAKSVLSYLSYLSNRSNCELLMAHC